jgi:hypothetical protein
MVSCTSSRTPLERAGDDLADTMGSARVDPIDPFGAVVDTLEFVHTAIRDQADRSRFDDDPNGAGHGAAEPPSINKESS